MGALNNQMGAMNHMGEIVGAFKSLTTVEYIRNNPAQWMLDDLYFV